MTSIEATTGGETAKMAQIGDIVTLDLNFSPENGYVPESLFDTQGIVTFALGWGNYLPGLHELVQGCVAGDEIQSVSVDAGWGSRRDDLLFEVSQSKLDKIVGNGGKSHVVKVGTTLTLPGDIKVLVKEIRADASTVILDANPPLAGTSYSCSFKVLDVSPLPTEQMEYTKDAVIDERYRIASFALGCFWGAELAFLRLPGVVGTQVGYSQGTTESPTYEQVCQGYTKHREATMVIYDSTVVSYGELMKLAIIRLEQTISSMELHQLFQEDDEAEQIQYKHGFYYHSPMEKTAAQDFLNDSKHNRFGIELLPATTFYQAEEYHHKYLFKGGQSAKKGCKEVIRCFG
eukprot:CAMPEP_0198145998 /NCGR_PEP_ID=MMETSP1443-20131203/26778_1 /TAXON_ID=186043 /ORGANISM="Entomoneis sp., Strain CCMP2396" /LENGTH=345 /DNA_ID=CAMNT_0043809791 /DNA_START=58 /DNA_END=1095 /DNA_ORIENTATION=-